MRQLVSFLQLLILITFFFGCVRNNSNRNTDQKVEIPEIVKDQSKKKYSGIWEAMAQEFEMTKDVRSGIVPSYRLVEAVDRDLKERKAGRLNRLSALSWVERGPNTNTVGPSNGNLRGPQNNAVTSGRMRTIWVDLNDPSNKTVWAGSVSGGLWKTTDITSSPSSWTLINDFFGNLAVTSITQDPVNKNILYFGTGEKTFNTDAVRGGGVWKSTDNGVTWNLLPSTVNFWNVSRVLCDGAGNVYVATIGSNGVQRSSDGGNTWINITPAGLSTRVTEMRLSSTGRLHVVCGYLNYPNADPPVPTGHRYTDNPATVNPASWSEPVTTYPTNYNTELAVAGNIIYALPSDANDRTPTIYKSTNGGVTWAPTVSSPPSGSSDSQASPSINVGQGWFDLAIGVDPANPDVVIAGGLNFFRSENGGVTWSRLSRWVGNQTMYIHADHHTVVWNGSQVMVGTDGGIFYSSDNGVTFTDRNIGLRTKQFYSAAIHPTLTNYFIGGTQDNGTHQMNNAGLSGSVEVIGGDGGFTHIDENEPQYQFSAFTQSNYIRSVNGGANWSAVSHSNSLGFFINPSDYDDQNNFLYASGGNSTGAGRYIRWNDPQTGASFSTISIGTATSGGITAVKVSPYTNNRIFVGSNQARVVRVDNAQLDFPAAVNISGSNFPSNGNTVSCINVGTTDSNLIASFSNYNIPHVFVTTTGGGASGWTNITGNLPNIPVRWAMFYPEDDDKAIIATEMGVFETDDINGAATVWIRNTTFPVVRTNMLQYRQLDGTLLAATHGRGLWTTSFPTTTPFIRFASSYTYSSAAEASELSSAICRKYKDYVVKMRVDQAPVGSATVTLNINGGTAVRGEDFDFSTNGTFTNPSSTITFPGGSAAEQSITIRVYDDAELENEESFTLSYTVTGTTNAIAAPSSKSFTFTIKDNDVTPVPGIYSGNFKVGTEQVRISTQTPLRSNKSRFRIQYLYTASQLGQAGILDAGFITSLRFTVLEKFSTKPFTGFTISMANSTASNLNTGFANAAFTQVYSGNYSSVVGENSFTFSNPFYWDGISNIVVNFCFDNGFTSPDASADVIEGASNPLGAGTRASTYSDDESNSGCALQAQLISEARINLTFGASSGNPIASSLNTTRTEFVSGNGIFHFYSGFDIISRIATASGNFGCVTSRVAEAGNTWQVFFAGPRSQKVIAVDFGGTAQNSSYTLGLYYTAAELAGKDPNLVRITSTNAGTVGGGNSTNTSVYATTFTSFGSGYLFTANVFGPGLFFLAEANITSIRNPSQQANFVKLLQNPISTSIPLGISNPSRVNIEATLLTNNGQLLQRWNLGRADGNRQLPLKGESLPAGVYILRIDAGTKTQSIKLVKQ